MRALPALRLPARLPLSVAKDKKPSPSFAIGLPASGNESISNTKVSRQDSRAPLLASVMQEASILPALGLDLHPNHANQWEEEKQNSTHPACLLLTRSRMKPSTGWQASCAHHAAGKLVWCLNENQPLLTLVCPSQSLRRGLNLVVGSS